MQSWREKIEEEKKKAGAVVGITRFSLSFAQYVLKGCEVNQFIMGSDFPPPWQSLEPLVSTSQRFFFPISDSLG